MLLKPETIVAAMCSLRSAYSTSGPVYGRVLREETSFCPLKWAEFQHSLNERAIKALAGDIGFSYWNYFFDSHSKTAVSLGKIYFALGDGGRESTNAMLLWESKQGRESLRQANVPRLAELSSANDSGSSGPNLVLPWVFAFDRPPTTWTSDGFYVPVSSSCINLLRAPLPVVQAIGANNWENILPQYLTQVKMAFEKNPDERRSIVDSFVSALRAARCSEAGAVAEQNIDKLVNYLAWLTLCFNGDLPAYGLYFPGTVGYSTLPDIGCAIGIKDDYLDAGDFEALTSLVDLSLYYSLQPFGPELEKAGRSRKEALRRAARAAVFARNFSHVIGSHVVSNPNFREALVGPAIRRLAANLVDAKEGFDAVLENYLQHGYRIDPQVYWDGGRRVLREARNHFRLTGAGGALTQSSRAFHEYLQGRFDFIARAIDETRDRPEPVYFVSDLLNGFLKQSAFLDTFVADLGVRLPHLKIVVTLPGMRDGKGFFTLWSEDFAGDTRVESAWKPCQAGSGYSWEEEKRVDNISRHDFMVGLPGGMVSVHAFYSLLENVIRNSVKYGRGEKNDGKRSSDYFLVIKIEEPPKQKNATTDSLSRVWHLRLSDNNSFLPRKELEAINNDLKRDFITDDGMPQREKLGLLEMQACATGLITPDLLPAAADNNERRNLVIDLPDAVDDTKPRQLVYKIDLAQPTLLALITTESGSAKTVAQSSLITCDSSIEDFVKNHRGAYLAVIDGDKVPDTGQLTEVQSIKKRRTVLPYRTLVLCKDKRSGDNWSIALKDSGLNPRRVLVRLDAALHKVVFECDTSAKFPVGDTGLKHEENLTLRCYRAWLEAWKETPLVKVGDKDTLGWHLWIGLERSAEQVSEHWKSVLEDFEKIGAGSDFAHIAVRSFQRDQNPVTLWTRCHPLRPTNNEGEPDDAILKKYWDAEIDKDGKTVAAGEFTLPYQKKRALVFDNHGQCFPKAWNAEGAADFRHGARFYQKLTGSQTPDLFRLLSHPPASPFAFAFFLYGLLESCLTNVMVVDERVAADLLFASSGGKSAGSTSNPNKRFLPDLLEHHKAGVFPVFSLRRSGASAPPADVESTLPGHFSQEHREALMEIVKALAIPPQPFTGDLSQEGLTIAARAEQENISSGQAAPQAPGTALTILAGQTKTDGKLPLGLMKIQRSVSAAATESEIACDVLLIHEGVLDLIAKNSGVEWPGKETDDSRKKLTELINGLRQFTPAVVRTSGRGRHTRHFPEELPFIEFSEVSSSLLTGRNKFALVRGLLGTSGELRT